MAESLASERETQWLVELSDIIPNAVSLVKYNWSDELYVKMWCGAIVHQPGLYLILATAKNGELI